MDARIIPQYIAIIMDGNGRRVKKRGLPRIAEHKQGAENIRRITIVCNTMGVKALTCYAFSMENWKCLQDEADYLRKLPKLFSNRYLTELKENNIKVTSLGEIGRFPDETRRVITTAVEQTQENTGLILCPAVNYGSRCEITLAVQRYAQGVQQRKANSEIDEDAFGSYMMTADMPKPDLMIRTSGELRISSLLPWQLAHAELIFTPVVWSDFSQEELNRATDEFSHRNRRFGGP